MQIRFEDINVPTERLDMVVEQNMYEIRGRYRKKKHWNYLVRGTVAAAAAISVAVVFTSNPALAAKLPLIGHIFERVQDNQRYSGNFNEVAEPVKEGNVSESDGITVTLSEIYSDSQAMYISAMIESEEPFKEKAEKSEKQEGEDTKARMSLEADQEYDFMTTPDTYGEGEWPGEDFEWNSLDLEGEYVDEHTFVGAMRIDFNLYPIGSFEVPDTFHWKLKVNKVENDNFSRTGEWVFETDVSVDQKGKRVVDVNQSAPNGEVIKNVTLTPYEVFVDTGFDQGKVEAGYERFDSVQSVMLDADGKLIKDKIGLFPAAGYNLSKITVYYFGTPTNEDYVKIQEKINDEAFQEKLKDYLEKIAIHKIEINL